MEDISTFSKTLRKEWRKNLSARLSDPSNRVGLLLALFLYASFGVVHNQYANLALIGYSIFLSQAFPYLVIVSRFIEEKLQLFTAFVSFGRLGRFLFQYAFVAFSCFFLVSGGVVAKQAFSNFGGVRGGALLLTLLLCGIQYFSVSLAERGVASRKFNTILGLAMGLTLSALAAINELAWAKIILLLAGTFSGGIIFLGGLVSDLRSVLYPQRGVGVFLGTFNPIHKVHIDLLKETIAERSLSKVYLHCASFNKFHQKALRGGEIKLLNKKYGLKAYRKTSRSEQHVDYFPKGNKFYDYKLRLELINVAIKEAGLSHKVKILDMKDTYETYGLLEVLKEIKRLHPKTPLHGIHGSDLGGMAMRRVYDLFGGVYPKSVRRRWGVSSRAIRQGDLSQTSVAVRTFLDKLKRKKTRLEVSIVAKNTTYGQIGAYLKSNSKPMAEA